MVDSTAAAEAVDGFNAKDNVLRNGAYADSENELETPRAANGDEIEGEDAAATDANVDIASAAMAAVEERKRAENEMIGTGGGGDDAFE